MSSRRGSAWNRHLIFIAVLLGGWVLATVIPVWLAARVAGEGRHAHLVYWVTAYGAPVMYLVLIAIYAWRARCARQSEHDDG